MEADRASGGACTVALRKPVIEAGVPNRIRVGHAGTGGEIARAVIFLVGNSYMTGQTIAVNGGSLFS
jgi:3-oxoacyl-[acyl-carrier protein] reductase